jgi:hypothetical protein
MAAFMPVVRSETASPTRCGPAPGSPSGIPGEAHQSSLSLNQIVVAGEVSHWTGLTKTRDRAVHKAGVEFREVLVAQPFTRQVAGLEVLHDDIGFASKSANDIQSLLLSKVNGDRVLAAIRCEKVGRLTRIRPTCVGQPGWAPVPCVVPFARALNLDHLGPEVREDLRAPGTGQNPR